MHPGLRRQAVLSVEARRAVGPPLRAAIAVGLLSVAPAVTAVAGEGGGSHYLQGTRSDFQAGVFGPAGIYYRNDLFYYAADIGARPLGGRVAGRSEQEIWANLAKVAYLGRRKVLGARYGAAVSVPLVIDAKVNGAAQGGSFGTFREGNVSGLGDVFLSPVLLNWKLGDHNLTLAPAGIFAPTGSYEKDRLINLGRNYWSFDVAASYTWLHPRRGHEMSASVGFMFNTENPDTNYTTGTEFHLDWLIGQYLSEHLGIGLNGYYYQQLEGDDGKVAGPINASNFQGRGVGLGPAAIVNVPLGSWSKLTVIGKALFDVDARDRFDGNLFILSAVLKL
jgi:hypothetical protein